MNNKETLSIIPLGGREEIGNNMIVLEYNNQILLLDCGIMFPTEQMPGINLIIPDFSYLINKKERIKGLLISHGHEDHIGAIPFFLKEFDIPIYGTKLTVKFIEERLQGNQLLKKENLNIIKAGQSLKLSPFKIKFIRVNHSIPDSVAMGIKTPLGTIIYTGDFKFDQSPINDKPIDFYNLAKLGHEGVLALLSDSTNAERKGYSLSERVVEENINNIFKRATGRVIVATFSSQISRIQEIINISYKYNRKVAISGRSMITNIKIAKENGYLDIPNNTLIEIRKINNLPNDQITLIMTGSQGETMASLSRIARKEHRDINLQKGDTILLSATPIPGNEKSVSKTINLLFTQGAKVIYDKELNLHASGHACQEELKMMINLTKPEYFIPVHGEYRHLYHHSLLAKKVGIPEENILIAKNGSRLNITSTEISFGEHVKTGKILIDNSTTKKINNLTLKERNLLAKNGIIIITISINKEEKHLIKEPELITKGTVQIKRTLLNKKIKRSIDNILRKYKDKELNYSSLKRKIKEELQVLIYNQNQSNPVIIPIIIEKNEEHKSN